MRARRKRGGRHSTTLGGSTLNSRRIAASRNEHSWAHANVARPTVQEEHGEDVTHLRVQIAAEGREVLRAAATRRMLNLVAIAGL